MTVLAVPRAERPGPPPSPGRRSVVPALTPWSVPLACCATLGTHLLFLTRQLGDDEGGFAMVARYWRSPGAYLYGPQWVDRPPALILVFDLADHLGAYGVRLTAAVLAVLLVAATATAAGAVGGRPAARWAAWTAFALASSALLQTQRLDGELIAATFVAVSVAALLVGRQRAAGGLLLCGFAGVTASTAVLVKQDFADALAFAGVLLGLQLLRAARTGDRTRCRRALTSAGAFAAGGALPLSGAAAWATAHGGVWDLLYAMYGFRADSAAVIASSWTGPLDRLEVMAIVAVLSGLAGLVVHLVWRHAVTLATASPLAWAVAAAGAVEMVGVAGGENFWPHYLIALVPTVALAAGLTAARADIGKATRMLVVLCMLSTAIASPALAVRGADRPSTAYTIGRWLAASAHRRDTLVVPFTHPNVINAAGLRPGYPYSWSLPVRTLDPRLTLLVRTLDGRSAPTWLVRWNNGGSWGLDPAHRVRASLRAHYRDVADICGYRIWLHRGVVRQLAAMSSPSECGPSASGAAA